MEIITIGLFGYWPAIPLSLYRIAVLPAERRPTRLIEIGRGAHSWEMAAPMFCDVCFTWRVPTILMLFLPSKRRLFVFFKLLIARFYWLFTQATLKLTRLALILGVRHHQTTRLRRCKRLGSQRGPDPYGP